MSEPKFSWSESPKGTLNLTILDGAKKTTWALSARSRTGTIRESFQGLCEALGGLPEARAERALPSPRPVPPDWAAEPTPGHTVSEWDEEAADEPFPAAVLLAAPSSSTEDSSKAALAAAAARIQKMSFWMEDPERLNPRLVADLDAGERPPELSAYTPSVRVDGRKLSQ